MNVSSSPVYATKIKVNAVWESLYPSHTPYQALRHIPKVNRVEKLFCFKNYLFFN